MTNEIPYENKQIRPDDNWMQTELNNLTTGNPDRLPALKLEEGKLTEIKVDFSTPWDKWTDEITGTVKKIIPVEVDKQKMVFFLNCSNPVYRELLQAGMKGQTTFKILRSGKAASTRYQLVKS